MTFTMNSAGMKALLLSPEVQAEMNRRADAVREAAQRIVGSSGVVTTKVSPTPNRARAEVFSPLDAESRSRALGISIDAARG